MLDNLLSNPSNIIFLRILLVFISVISVATIAFLIYNSGFKPKQESSVNSEPIEISMEMTTPFVIYVDVSGNVNKPGIVSVDSSKRVGDALFAAGGIKDAGSTAWVSKNINLAQKLEDGMKIYVPFEWDIYQKEDVTLDEISCDDSLGVIKPSAVPTQAITKLTPTVTPSKSSVSGKVNVNSASAEELDSLSGIGPAYAQRIITGRPYKNFDELTSKSKVAASTLNKIKDQITF